MTTRRIVLDANILIRAVLGIRVRELIERYGERTSFFAPALAFEEAARHLPTIATKRGADPAPLLDSLDRLSVLVEAIPIERSCRSNPLPWPVSAHATRWTGRWSPPRSR